MIHARNQGGNASLCGDAVFHYGVGLSQNWQEIDCRKCQGKIWGIWQAALRRKEGK